MTGITLFHGTDARIIEMTNEERLEYLDCCNMVIDALYPLFKPLLTWEKVECVVNGEKIVCYEYPLKLRYEKVLNEKGGQFMYTNLLEKLKMIEARYNASALYQYGSLYLCDKKSSAMRYSQRSYAGGETGLMAYRLIEGVEHIGFDTPYKSAQVEKAVAAVKEFGKEGSEKPAIVTISAIDPAYLSFEDGKPLDADDIRELEEGKRNSDRKFRYGKPIELKDCKVELLNRELYNQILEEEKNSIF